MAEFDLEKLQDIKVPEAKLSAKQHTLQSALSEFDEQQKRKGSFSLSTLLPDWLNLQESLWNILNPRVAGAFSLLILVGLGSIIYLPEIAKQPAPEEIAPKKISKEKDISPEKSVADKAEEVRQEKESKPVPITPQPLATPGIQELKKRTLPQKAVPGNNSTAFGNGNARKFHSAPSIKRKTPRIAPSGMRIQQLGNSAKNTEIGNSSIGRVATKKISTQNFPDPRHKGKALHHCLQASDQCGQVVADRFCALKKMGKAKAFQIEEKTASETISIQNDKIFKSTGTFRPLTFKSITCFPPAKK